MALASKNLIEALRTAAQNLKNGAKYAWGHHGQCNCGHLAQEITQFSAGEILKYAQTGAGEWTELADDYCEISDAPAHLLMRKLMDAGLTPTDIHNIEYLCDRDVLHYLPSGFRWLSRNKREDTIAYFEAMADMLENEMLQQHLKQAMRENILKLDSKVLA
jgi:hypothetical protein